ncbi:hypothetical protein BD311DRAFT_757891 [Dichomitus squalens]|uniref:Uncharacterized protein n=1 Tax=Dichomitus squalens TaxID=114155 RepID=A0A4Q9MMB5_9APHY|nr:hypothetical protein BD311DRAFT_757891 [Dichomitus squalens]
MSPTSAYVPLLHSDPDAHYDDGVFENDMQSKESFEQPIITKPHFSRVVYWTCALSLLFSGFNLLILGFKITMPNVQSSSHLEYASSYIGLDTLYKNRTPSQFAPITSFPILIAQVNQSDPRAVYLDTHRWSSTFGTVYPEDRRVLLTPTVTTYLQFWAGDFGMERCVLKLMVPSAVEDDVALSNVVTTLQVWQIKTPGKLDVQKLSWAHRPQRSDLVASWVVRPNSTFQSMEYRCPSGSFQTFELSCLDSGCLVDFHQKPKQKDLGFWLLQHSSL